MSATSTAPSKSGGKPATPPKVLLLFIGALLTPLLVTLLVFQLNIPLIGGTLGSALFSGISLGFEVLFMKMLPSLGAATAANYTVLTGAVGVLWMTIVHRRVRRTGVYRPSVPVDGLMLLLSIWLFLIYFCYMGTTVTVDAKFVTRLALYSAISTVVFNVTVLFAWLADAMGDDFVPRENAKEAEEYMGLFLMSLLAACISVIVTGFYDGDSPSVSFFTYQLPNVLMHFAANAGGIFMALWFVLVVEGQARKKKSDAKKAAAGSPVAGPLEGEGKAGPAAHGA